MQDKEQDKKQEYNFDLEYRTKVANLIKSEKEDERARGTETFINCIMHFIEKEVNKKYYNFIAAGGYFTIATEEDLVQSICARLLDILPTYDPTFRFTTFTEPYIIEVFNRTVEAQSNTSAHYAAIIKEIENVEKIWKELHLGVPSLKDLSIETGRSYFSIYKANDIRHSRNTVSLDKDKDKDNDKDNEKNNKKDTIGTDDLKDNQTNDIYKSPEQVLLERARKNDIMKGLSTLNETEHYILCSKLGFNAKKKNYVEIAEDTGLTPEVVKRIFGDIIERLKYNKDILHSAQLTGIRTRCSRPTSRDLPITRIEDAEKLLDDIDNSEQ